MNPTFQSGTHPDAEVLTAFAEQLVSDREREEILVHIARCRRCREVVFMTQRMAEAEEPSHGFNVSVPKAKTRGGWFAVWRWSWVPVAALAAIVGFAVIQHRNQAPRPVTQLAQNAPSPETPQSTAAANANIAPQRQTQPAHAESKDKPAVRERSDRGADSEPRSLDETDKLVAQKKDETPAAPGSLAASHSEEPAGGFHGTIAGRAKTSGLSGPMAQNQMQQQNYTQLQQQSNANEAGQNKSLADSANKPISQPAPGSVSESVAVEASSGPVPATPAPSAAPTVSSMQMETAELRDQKLAKAKQSVLPSKLEVLSQTKAGRTIVAIDTAGSVFVCEDGGRHWQAVNPQWTGRPVLVKPRSTPATGGGFLKQPAPRFELTTDKHEIWVSEDGRSWTPEPLTGR